MEQKNQVVYFELNNWIRGRHFPDAEPFINWMGDDLNLAFNNDEWVKENKLCVVRDIIDMSINFCITASRDWVEKNCPSLLTEYTEFIRYPDKYGDVEGNFGTKFLEYNEDNFGIVDSYDEDI